MKYSYPAIFDFAEDGVNVTFPDIWGGVTCGDTEDDALFMAKDLLTTMLSSAPAQCNKPTPLEEMQAKFPDKKVILVEVNL